VRVWEAATGQLIAVLHGHTDAVNSASFARRRRRSERIYRCSVCGPLTALLDRARAARSRIRRFMSRDAKPAGPVSDPNRHSEAVAEQTLKKQLSANPGEKVMRAGATGTAPHAR
jgi:hypothetical protein